MLSDTLPDDPQRWVYELTLDGYRAGDAIKDGRVPNAEMIVVALQVEPAAVIDGEIVAFDDEGRPFFNVLQNYASSPPPYVFDVFMVLQVNEVTSASVERRQAPFRARCSGS